MRPFLHNKSMGHHMKWSLSENYAQEIHMLYPGTLPPEPLDTALLEDEDVRFPETKFVNFFLP